MKNKKGFTLVELVIVIAVIAILAGVLIGTFASVMSSANQSTALQEWKALVDSEYLDFLSDKHVVPSYVIVEGKTIQFLTDAPTTEGTKYFEFESVDDTTAKYIQLDEENKVYLVIDVDNSYSVQTSKSATAAEAIEVPTT